MLPDGTQRPLESHFRVDGQGNYGFEVVDVIEGIIDARQDLVILRRPEASHPSEKYFRDFPRPDGT